MTTEIVATHCALCLNVAGERVPVHSGSHLFEGHPEKDGAWWDHWELRRKGLEAFGEEFDADALKMFGYRPRDRWGLEPRKIRPNYGDPERQWRDLEAGTKGGTRKASTTSVALVPEASTTYLCGQCGHQWTPRKAGVPVRCAACKSRQWAREKSALSAPAGESDVLRPARL